MAPTIKGVVFGLVIFLVAAFGLVFETVLLAVVYPFSRRLARHVIGTLTRLWFELAGMLLIHMLGLRLVVHGNEFSKKPGSALLGSRSCWHNFRHLAKSNMLHCSTSLLQLLKPGSGLYISNHPTRVDWMLLWPYFAHLGVLPDLKIVLKAPLRKIPAIGWHIQLANFIFLERDLVKDKQYIQRACDLLGAEMAELQREPTVLIFPEVSGGAGGVDAESSQCSSVIAVT